MLTYADAKKTKKTKQVDKLRRVDGREATFVNWPHANNPALCAAVMARAGEALSY